MGDNFIPTGIATGIGSNFATQVVVTMAAAGTFVLPAGNLCIYAVGADVRLQIQDSTGTWQNITAAGVNPGDTISDGINKRLINNGVGSETATYIKIN